MVVQERQQRGVCIENNSHLSAYLSAATVAECQMAFFTQPSHKLQQNITAEHSTANAFVLPLSVGVVYLVSS